MTNFSVLRMMVYTTVVWLQDAPLMQQDERFAGLKEEAPHSWLFEDESVAKAFAAWSERILECVDTVDMD